MPSLAEKNIAPVASEDPGRKSLVLLIEKDEDLRFLFRTALEMHDLDVIEAAGGDDIVQSVMSEHVDLVLMDYGCSNTTCLETLQSIRRAVPETELPIFVLSSFADTVFLQRIRAAGCSEFFVQPVDVFSLGNAIENRLCKKSPGNRFVQ